MISRELVLEHERTHFPLDGLSELGLGLARHQWDRDTELSQLTETLADLHAEPGQVAVDLEALDATEGQISSITNMPLTINAVRRGILYRNLPPDAKIDPRMQEIYDRNGRGIWGEDGKVEALGAGFLLSAFMSGLDEGGFARRRSKAILGEQFEHVLKTECEGRSSYGAVSGMRFLYRVMKYSELHTPASRLTQIRRGRYLLANFNLELDDF